MTTNHVKITMPDGNPDHANTVVEIDGHDITSQVCGFTVVAKVGKFTEVTLDLVAVEYQHKGETRVHLAEGVTDTLTRLGWTPPGQRSTVDADGNTHTIDWSKAKVTVTHIAGEYGPELDVPKASGGIVKPGTLVIGGHDVSGHLRSAPRLGGLTHTTNVHDMTVMLRPDLDDEDRERLTKAFEAAGFKVGQQRSAQPAVSADARSRFWRWFDDHATTGQQLAIIVGSAALVVATLVAIMIAYPEWTA